MQNFGKSSSKIVLIALLSAGFCGCGMYDKLVKKNPTPQSQLAKQDWTKPLKPEEKIDVQMAVARSLRDQGETDQAIKVYQEIIKKDPKRVDAYHQLALIYDKKGDPQSSEKYYRQALKRDPKNIVLLADFGYSCYLQERWKESEQFLRQALALDPEFRRAHNNYGLLLARTGREEQALKEFARTGVSQSEARSNLGYALMQQKHWDEAREQFQLALSVDPQSKNAKEGMKTLDKVVPQPEAPMPENMAEQRQAKATPTAFITVK